MMSSLIWSTSTSFSSISVDDFSNEFVLCFLVSALLFSAVDGILGSLLIFGVGARHFFDLCLAFFSCLKILSVLSLVITGSVFEFAAGGSSSSPSSSSSLYSSPDSSSSPLPVSSSRRFCSWQTFWAAARGDTLAAAFESSVIVTGSSVTWNGWCVSDPSTSSFPLGRVFSSVESSSPILPDEMASESSGWEPISGHESPLLSVSTSAAIMCPSPLALAWGPAPCSELASVSISAEIEGSVSFEIFKVFGFTESAFFSSTGFCRGLCTYFSWISSRGESGILLPLLELSLSCMVGTGALFTCSNSSSLSLAFSSVSCVWSCLTSACNLSLSASLLSVKSISSSFKHYEKS